MIMVHKPVHFISSPTIHHRRLPSAPPAVLVQPTRTPGLLSLSKPAPPRQQPRTLQQRQPKASKAKGQPATAPRATLAASAEPSADVAVLAKDAAAVVKDVASISASKGKPSTQALSDKDTNTRSSRGRQRSKANKEKADLRNVSRSAVVTGSRRRQPHHQGSPPQSSSLAAREESKENADRSPSPQARTHNQFDPFLANSSDSESDSTRSSSPAVKPVAQALVPEPKLASHPTGKLARRRQPGGGEPPSPTPSRAMPVPRGKAQARDPAPSHLSRSAPGMTEVPARPRPTHTVSDKFPICDDMTDIDEPSTSTRGVTWQQQQQQSLHDDGPRTAPLSSTFFGSPFFPRASTPTPPRHRVNHVRSPSEGVFNLSFDDDSSASSSSEELKALVGLLPRRRNASTTTTPPAKRAGVRPPNFFASSNFQNSPSPDDLPAPLF